MKTGIWRTQLAKLVRLLGQERGEVGVDAGMVGSESIDAAGDSPEASFDGFTNDDDTTGVTVREEVPEQGQHAPLPQQPTPDASQDESFIDPASLPPELKPHWSRMHRAYTQALEGARGVQDKASTVDRFYSDPQFAQQTVGQWAQANPQAAVQAIGQWAQANGVRFVSASEPQPAPQAPQGTVPEQIVNAMRQQLKATTPELEWMAPSLAPAMWAAIQQAVAPLAQAQQATHQQSQAAQQAQRQHAQHAHYQQQVAGYDALAGRLSETHPGWEAHEQDMSALMEYLVSPALDHPQFGSKLEMLYNLATGGAAATQKAVKRMNEATKLRAGSGQVGRSGVANIAERVQNAKTRSDAFRIAGEAAIASLG